MRFLICYPVVLMVASFALLVSACSEGEQESVRGRGGLEISRSDLNTSVQAEVHSAFQDFNGTVFSNATKDALIDALTNRVNDMGAVEFYGPAGLVVVRVRYPDNSFMSFVLREGLRFSSLVVVDMHGNEINLNPDEQGNWVADPDYLRQTTYWMEGEVAQSRGTVGAWVEELRDSSGMDCIARNLSGRVSMITCK